MLKNKDNLLKNALNFYIKNQVGKPELWEKLVNEYRKHSDVKGGYKGEYWGKIMRGACLIQKYTGDEKLYKILEDSITDLISTQDEDGRISSYKRKDEFCGWDLWSRKYVAIGLEYFYDIAKGDEIKSDIIDALTRHLDYIIDHVGSNGKEICLTSNFWGGVNSCSILKAFVICYRLTKEQRYLDYARYIISTGGTVDFDLIEASVQNVLPISDYKYTKAYEITSFFEGVLEYYKVTKEQRLLDACVNYANAIIKEEFTVIGSGACATECYNFSKYSQTVVKQGPMQETCVTASFMLYFGELYKVLGDVKYLDEMEISFYNAILGTLNEEYPERTHNLPVDWYSPLSKHRRSYRIVGGMQRFSDGSIYSCCTAISPVGVGVFAENSVIKKEGSIIVNFFDNRVIETTFATITESTSYPKDGNILFDINNNSSKFLLTIRIPYWCKNYSVTLNGNSQQVSKKGGYISITAMGGDKIALDFDMPYTYGYIPATKFSGGYLYFQRGPIILAEDKRYTSLNTHFITDDPHRNKYDFTFIEQPDDNSIFKVVVKCGKEQTTLIDYASAGGTYSGDSALNVFIPYHRNNFKEYIKVFLDRRSI